MTGLGERRRRAHLISSLHTVGSKLVVAVMLRLGGLSFGALFNFITFFSVVFRGLDGNKDFSCAVCETGIFEGSVFCPSRVFVYPNESFQAESQRISSEPKSQTQPDAHA